MALMVIDNRILDYQVENVKDSLERITNQIFKLLPTFEDGKDWIKPLDTLVIEITGMALVTPNAPKLYQLVYKLQGIKEQGKDIEFMLFRRMIFEACNIANDVRERL